MGGGEKLTGACGNDILGRHLRNGEHGRNEKLTTKSDRGGCGIREASTGRVDDGGGWREKKWRG